MGGISSNSKRMRRAKPSKWKQIFDIIVKYGKPTIGTSIVIICVFLVIFKKISIETLGGIILALISAGLIPKEKKDDEESR
jgi:hypothetical protein